MRPATSEQKRQARSYSFIELVPLWQPTSAESDAEAESGAKSESDSDAESGAKSESDSDAESDSDSESDSDAESETETLVVNAYQGRREEGGEEE
ncbi:MAG: hypothetical protein VYE22_20250 [Myxococcota bacterium]|nr:hypothetical protein [Myxococcota bacterium]